MAERLSDKLALAFTRKRTQLKADVLPLPFGKTDTGGEVLPARRIGLGFIGAGVVPIAHAIGLDFIGRAYRFAPPVNRMSYCLVTSNSATLTVGNSIAQLSQALPVASCQQMDYGVTISVIACHFARSAHFVGVNNCHRSSNRATAGLIGCHHGDFANIVNYGNCSEGDSQPTQALANCKQGTLSDIKSLTTCSSGETLPTTTLETLIDGKGKAYPLVNCDQGDSTPAVRIPCQWYKVILPEPEPEYVPPCKPRPPSDQLPLAFVRRKQPDQPNDMLPLPFACMYTPTPDRKKTYMIYNTVTAEIDDQPVGIYSAQISTDMDSFCWTFSVDIDHRDFAKFRLDSRDDEALLNIVINGHQWVMLVEDYGERKAFNFDGYTLTGRSRTAVLTGDYAKRKSAIVNIDMYASQLAQVQLEGLPFTLEYDSDADWFVPAGTYTSSGTPIDAIMDIAKAGGHYVASDPVKPILYIRKRYPLPAWEIDSNSADRQISALTWLELSGQRRVSQRYNSVRLAGFADEGGHVCRSINAGAPTPEAPVQTHVLYGANANNTPVAAWRNKGIEVLSQSGKHKRYTLNQLWADDPQNPENIVLSRLGDLVEVFDIGGTLGAGVVNAVTIDIEPDNDATFITQSPVIDVYLDE